jgi:hypothetical protein
VSGVVRLLTDCKRTSSAAFLAHFFRLPLQFSFGDLGLVTFDGALVMFLAESRRPELESIELRSHSLSAATPLCVVFALRSLLI